VLLDQLLGFGNLLRLQPVIRVEFNGRLDPEFCLAVRMLDMHMRPQLLTREKVEAKASNAQDRWTHRYRIADPLDAPAGGESSGGIQSQGDSQAYDFAPSRCPFGFRTRQPNVLPLSRERPAPFLRISSGRPRRSSAAAAC